MVINHNISALNTYNRLSKNESATESSLAKLSSGLKINSASDNAAGLSISQKMQAQINGLNQATSNAEDGVSLVQTAEGALDETESVLQRMRELAVQSSSDTNTDSDRQSMQDEMTQLESQIDNIANTTQFNTKNLLDGTLSASSTLTASVDTNSSLTSTAALATTTVLSTLEDTDGNSLGIGATDTITISYEKDGAYNTLAVTGADTIADLGDSNVGFTVSSGDVLATAAGTGYSNQVTGLTITVKDATGKVNSAATQALSAFTETTGAANANSDGTAVLQIGANAGQSMTLSIGDMSAEALGVKSLDITSQDAANTAINAIDAAISKVNSQLSNFGAVENRLTSTENNLSTESENLTSASSQITDVDMASEMTNFTKNNILTQAAESMLAQANQLPSGVLSLLK